MQRLSLEKQQADSGRTEAACPSSVSRAHYAAAWNFKILKTEKTRNLMAHGGCLFYFCFFHGPLRGHRSYRWSWWHFFQISPHDLDMQPVLLHVTVVFYFSSPSVDLSLFLKIDSKTWPKIWRVDEFFTAFWS